MGSESTSYRRLFYCALLMNLAALSVTGLLALKFQQLEYATMVSSPFPITNYELRDREFEFTVTNYGFHYKGITGNTVDDHVLLYGAWEKHMLFFMEDYVARAQIADRAFVDVGANTGQHSLFMASRVAEVHAFEPYPPVISRFDENVELNEFDNIILHELGLGDQNAEIPFYAPSKHNQAIGTFRKETHENADTREIGTLRIVAGDDYLESQETAPIGIIKIDIEGFEEAALRGLRKTIERHRPLVIVEVSTPPRGTIRSLTQLEELFPSGYEFMRFGSTHALHLDGAYKLRDAKAFIQQNEQDDFVAFPNERRSQVPVIGARGRQGRID